MYNAVDSPTGSMLFICVITLMSRVHVTCHTFISHVHVTAGVGEEQTDQPR